MSLKLYEIAGEYRALMDILETSEEEEIDADSFSLAMNALAGDFTAKATNIGCLVRELDAEFSAIQETARRMNARAERIATRSEKLQDYLLREMQATGIENVSDSRIRIAIRKNPPSVYVETADGIPADYIRIIPEKKEPDKTAIKAALKAGIAIPGCSLIQTTRLVIQ